MSGTPASQLVVVGVDGSPESAAALRFAVDEAKLRGAVLRIVCAWAPSDAGYMGEVFAPTPEAFDQAEHHAEGVLREALKQLQGESLEIEAVAEEGGAPAVLHEQAADAVLLVVGSRGLGAAKRLMLGSVSHELTHKAPCPVVVVPS